MAKPNPFQVFVRGVIKDVIDEINGQKREKPINAGSVNNESWYRDRLAQQLNGKTEVVTPVGRIDVLTKTEVIEIKRASNWKSAIGQVKSYGKFYPEHRLRIHLFGEITASKLKTIQSVCESEGIISSWE